MWHKAHFYLPCSVLLNWNIRPHVQSGAPQLWKVRAINLFLISLLITGLDSGFKSTLFPRDKSACYVTNNILYFSTKIYWKHLQRKLPLDLALMELWSPVLWSLTFTGDHWWISKQCCYWIPSIHKRNEKNVASWNSVSLL